MKNSNKSNISYSETISVNPGFFSQSGMTNYNASNDGPCDLTTWIDCKVMSLGNGPILPGNARIRAVFISPFFSIEKKVEQSTKTEPVSINRYVGYDNSFDHSQGRLYSTINIAMSGPKEVNQNELVSKHLGSSKPFEIEDLLHFDLTIFYTLEN